MYSPRTRRDVVARVASTVGAIGLAGCTSLMDGARQTPDGNETTSPGTETATANGTPAERGGARTVGSLAVATTDTEYAVLGAEDASETGTLYWGWKCPYTQNFVTGMLPSIIETYIAPGALAVECRAVRFQADESWGDDEPRANRAGLAVWHETPQKFPAYVETLFANQPPEETEWATVDQLVAFAEQAGIANTDPIRKSITSGEYSALWKDTMDVVSEKGIEGIPRFELGNRITAPTINPDATEQQLEEVFK